MTSSADKAKALLDAIRAEPDNDELRLVYGDFLIEQGDAARGELIGLQCGASKDDPGAQQRTAELIKEHAVDWLYTLGIGLNNNGYSFERGFLHRVRLGSLDDAFDAIPQLVAHGPVPLIEFGESKIVVSSDGDLAAVYVHELRAAAYRAVGELRVDIYDVAARTQIIPTISRVDEVTNGTANVPTPVWLRDGRLGLRYGANHDEIIELPPRIAPQPPSPSKRELIELLVKSGHHDHGWDWERHAPRVLDIPDSDFVKRVYDEGKFFVTRKDFDLEALSDRYVSRVTANAEDYGIAIYGRGTKGWLLFADIRRRCVVREMLYSFHDNVDSKSWAGMLAVVRRALDVATNASAGQVLVCDDGRMEFVELRVSG